jgi:trk system potassium uptake protein TrkH
MRNLRTVLHYFGIILIAFAFLQALPLVISTIYAETVTFPVRIYAIPAAVAAFLGLLLVSLFKPSPLNEGMAMAIGALGWFGLSLIGAVPYWLALKITYLDAFFETVSGFTTTGTTLFVGLDGLPHSILFWRALTQWIGGLGIFTLFLVIALRSGISHNLLQSESHKATTKRFSPGMFNSLRILWAIYITLTILCGLALWIERLSPFDAIVHALTTISTGGFSSHDASIAYFHQSGYHYVAIDYTLILFMFLGGTSFLVHWNIIRRRFKALRVNMELRLWVLLIIGATLIVAFGGGMHAPLGERIRASLFQVVAIASSTGFATKNIAGNFFGPAAKQVFLLLMFIGGCVGSTAGGVKVWRIGVLGKLLRHQLRLISRPSREVVPFVIDGEVMHSREVYRTAAITFAWVAIATIGSLITGLLTGFGPLESFSGMISALSNIGPSYIDPTAYVTMNAGLKVFYILAMVAGRLELLPLFLIFSRRVWR